MSTAPLMKPKAPAVQLGTIPDELKAIPRWVLWRFVPDALPGKFKKVPFCGPHKTASSTDPDTWASYDDVADEYLMNPGAYAGIGFVLVDDSIVGVDLDRSVDPSTGALSELASKLVKDVVGYAEISPSGKGIKMLTRASIASGAKCDPAGIEVYKDGRFFTITGQVLPGCVSLPDAEQPLDWLVAHCKAEADRFRAERQGLKYDPSASGAGYSSRALISRQLLAADPTLAAFIEDKAPLEDWTPERFLRELAPLIDWDSYDDWLRVGMACHFQGEGSDDWLEAWDEASQASSKYAPGACQAKWESFYGADQDSITLASIIHENKEAWLKRREELKEQEEREAFEDWQKELTECDSPRAIEGRLIYKMVCLRLSAFDEERARKLIKEKLAALGAQVSDKTLSNAIKDAKGKLSEQRRSQLVDVEVALARRVLIEHFGGVDGPHLKRFGSGWWMYIGGLWRPTEQDLIENRVAATIVRVKERGDADVKELAAFMAEQGRGDYLGALVSAVASHLKRLCGGEDAIADPLDLMGKNLGSVINCRNGELWFNSDGEVGFLDHNPAHNLTSQIACDYDPSATCPVFEAALARVFSLAREPQEMIRHWLELMGTIVQPTRLEAFWVMMKGPGGNGKSFLVEIIESLMGLGSCYKGSIAEIEKGSNVHFTASLVGKLMFFDDDVKKGVPLPDDWLKKLSEEKVLTANPKNKNTFEFVNRAVAVMLCNHWPHTSDVSHGMIRRAHVIETNYIIPKEQIRVGEQKYIIDNELPGVLNLLIAGWRRVLRRGGFARPAEVVESVARWIDKANLTQRFIGSVLVKSDKAGVKTSVAQAYQEYKQWIELNEGPGCRPVGRRSFDEALESAGIEISVQHNQKVLRGYFLATLAGLSAEDAFGDVNEEKTHDNAIG